MAKDKEKDFFNEFIKIQRKKVELKAKEIELKNKILKYKNRKAKR